MSESMAMSDTAARTRLLRAAGAASVAAALVIVAIKLVVWLQTGAASVLAALVDSGMDLISSAINLAALSYAARPPDDDHRYGHGKAEALAAFVQALALLGSAAVVIWHAVAELVAPAAEVPLTGPAGPLAVAGMIATMVITAALVLFQRHVVRRTGSQLIAADSLHYRSDFLINGAVLVALLLSGTARWLDPLLAVLIALYIAHAAVRILRSAVNELLDRELPAVFDDEVLAIARAHPAVHGAHGLRTREAGGRYFVQFDLDFPAGTTLAVAHEAATAIRLELQARFPTLDAQIHFDPVDDDPGFAARAHRTGRRRPAVD